LEKTVKGAAFSTLALSLPHPIFSTEIKEKVGNENQDYWYHSD